MITTAELRKSFLEFFRRHAHEIRPSSPLVPHNDPSLMFTNAGMVQFKNAFTGVESLPYKRAATSQKCVRAGGKHNDLDNVGYTARHHTFFEMLGNFSFGDYFKETAIPLAWEFLTKELKLPPERLYITVYHTDNEAFDIWRKITGFGEDRIFRISTSDNFWQMGDTGPCGPCSEIYYNYLDTPPNDITNAGDDCIEIWNLVFMQYEQLENGERIALPSPSIDTGMGLERLTAVLQGVRDNFDIDLFKRLIEASVQETGVQASGDNKFSHRIIADHLRASAFLIADGVMPSNEGRGYVLRRIMRRAMRHAHHLDKEPLMYRLLPALVSVMGDQYPELIRAQSLIRETLKAEEERFRRTLERGLKLLDEEEGKITAGGALPGDIAFKLYDTFGFPVDLTADILRGKQKQVDMAGFEAAMLKQKEEARKGWSGSGGKAASRIWFELKEKVGASEFLGYSLEKNQASVTAIVIHGEAVNEAGEGMEIEFLTNQTCFYGESGGQVGDIGFAYGRGLKIEITNTIKPLPDLYVHQGVIRQGSLKLGYVVELVVDGERRSCIRANHSATHILHRALRKILGDHVTQKGSLVAADKLRFDFSHNKAVRLEELEIIEREVNRVIRQNSPVATRLMTPDDAMQAGAMALFGEKYGDEVRVINMGLEDVNHYSLELCGGTHVNYTGDIGFFRITGEASVSSGIRRIEGLTGEAAIRFAQEEGAILGAAAAVLKSGTADVVEKISSLQDEKKKLEKQLSDLKKQAAGSSGAVLEVEKTGEVNFGFRIYDDLPIKDLKVAADEFKKQIGSGVIALITRDGGKLGIVIGVTDDLTKRINAADLARSASIASGGQGGGGRADLAQSGSPDATRANDALAEVRRLLV